MNIHFTQENHKPVAVEAMVTNLTRSGSAFARDLSSNRDIFISANMVQRHRVDRGEKLIAMTVPSRAYLTWRPEHGTIQPAELFAIHVMSHDEYQELTDSQPDEIIEEETLEDRILSILQNGPATASAITDIIDDGTRIQTVFDTLCAMHRDGEVCRATIKARECQKQASRVVWALTIHELTPSQAKIHE